MNEELITGVMAAIITAIVVVLCYLCWSAGYKSGFLDGRYYNE